MAVAASLDSLSPAAPTLASMIVWSAHIIICVWWVMSCRCGVLVLPSMLLQLLLLLGLLQACLRC